MVVIAKALALFLGLVVGAFIGAAVGEAIRRRRVRRRMAEAMENLNRLMHNLMADQLECHDCKGIFPTQEMVYRPNSESTEFNTVCIPCFNHWEYTTQLQALESYREQLNADS